MSTGEKPKIMLVEDNGDASTVLAGTLYLKGCDVYKTEGTESCLKTLTDLDGKVDVVAISHETVGNKDMDLIIGIKKINFEIKILVIGNDIARKGSIIDFGADEFALKPLSPENMADKVLMLMAKEASIANRDK
jgi:DNA-binding NtrC family response regulator